MDPTESQDTAALQALRELTQQQGQQLSRPVAAWRPGGRAGAAASAWALVMGAVLAATTCVAWSRHGPPSAAAPRPVPPATGLPQPFQALALATPRAEVASAVRLEQPLAAVAPQASKPRGEAHIELRAGVIHMRLQGVSMKEAVRLLAGATQSTVHGLQALPASASMVSIDWRGSDADAAWHRLLGDAVSYASRCAGNECVVWVVGPIAAARATGAVSSAAAAGALAPLPLPSTKSVPPKPPQEDSRGEIQQLLTAYGAPG